MNKNINDMEVNIVINGNLNTIDIDVCNTLKVTGDVKELKTLSGDVDVTGNVTGDIKTMSGDVKCGNVGGKIKIMSGDVKYRK